MMEAAKAVGAALRDYERDNAGLPDSLAQVHSYLPDWPVNPYNYQPVVDTGKPDFDPATSVGNVYYRKFYRDDDGNGGQVPLIRGFAIKAG